MGLYVYALNTAVHAPVGPSLRTIPSIAMVPHPLGIGSKRIFRVVERVQHHTAYPPILM